MPSIVIKEPNIENFRVDRPIGWRREERTRSNRVTKELRPDGVGGHLKIVRRSSNLTCTTHQRHVSKPSNSYETSKVEDQSKSEGLSIGVKRPPQYQQGYDSNNGLNHSTEQKLEEESSRSFLRIGQHEKKHRTYVGTENRIGIFNNNVQDNNIRPSKMQKVIPTSLIIAEDTKQRNKSHIVNNMAASETSCEQFTTTEGNRRLRRNTFKSHNYYKTVTKTSRESSEGVESSQTTDHVTSSGESYQNEFRSPFLEDRLGDSKKETSRNRCEMENYHYMRTLSGKVKIPEDRHKRTRNHTKIFIENESMKLDARNASTSDDSTLHPNNKRELEKRINRICKPININISRSCDTIEKSSSSFMESSINSSPCSLFFQKSLTNGSVSPSSRHELYNHTKNNNTLSLENVSPIFKTIHKPHVKLPCKKYQETDYKFAAESCSTLSPKIYTDNLNSLEETKTHTIRLTVNDLQLRDRSENPRTMPTVTFRKINQESSKSWRNKKNWKEQESLFEDSTSYKRSQNLTEHSETSSLSSKSNPLKEQNCSLKRFSCNLNGSCSTTDEDRSMNEFVMEQSKSKQSPMQYYFGVPTAKIRTKNKKEINSITLSPLDLPYTEKLLSKRLISKEEKENYQESWSGSEQQTTQHSSIKEINNENSFFKETRNRRGPVEVCFSVKSHSQTKIVEDPFMKERNTKDPSRVVKSASKDDMSRNHKKNVFIGKCLDTTELRSRPMSAEEYKNETTFSRESKTTKDPLEIRLSVTSIEHQRALGDNTEQLTEKLCTVKTLEGNERNKNLLNEIESSEEMDQPGVNQQQKAERENKRRKISKERKGQPVEVSFSVKSCKKKTTMQNNCEDLKLQKPIFLQDDLEHERIRNVEKHEEMHIKKLQNLKETTENKNNTSRISVNDLLITSREEKRENVSSIIIKQSPINERRKINSTISSAPATKESAQKEADDQTINKLSFKEHMSKRITDIKEKDESIRKISVQNYIKPITKYFNDRTTNNSKKPKEYLSTNKSINQTSSNESLHIKNATKHVPKSSINAFGSPVTEYSSTYICQKNVRKIPTYNAEDGNRLKNNTFEANNGFSTISKSRDVSSNSILIDTFNRKEGFAANFSVEMEQGKDVQTKHENAVKIADTLQPPKSMVYIKQMLNNKLNTDTILRLKAKETKKSISTTTENGKVTCILPYINQLENKSRKDEKLAKHQVEPTDQKNAYFLSVRDYNLEDTNMEYDSSLNSSSYFSISNLQSDEATAAQRHLLSPLNTTLESGQQQDKESDKTIHRCEFKLNINDNGAAVTSKEIPAINEKNIVCYLQSQPNHGVFRLKNWKEEVIINRILFDVKNVDKPKEPGMQECRKSNYIKVAPTDWARSTEYNSFQLKFENKIGICKEIIPVSQKNLYRSSINIETGSVASQRTRDRPINGIETSTKKESSSGTASDSSSMLNRPHDPKKYQKGDEHQDLMMLQSIEKGLKKDSGQPDIYCIYETSL